jgi:hypothetical protein
MPNKISFKAQKQPFFGSIVLVINSLLGVVQPLATPHAALLPLALHCTKKITGEPVCSGYKQHFLNIKKTKQWQSILTES